MTLFVDITKNLPGFKLKISFAAAENTVGLLGASGSGKTMTLRNIAGLVTPDSGKIILNGRVLFDAEKGINLPSRQRKVGYLFQNYALFPHLNVQQNIAFGLRHFPRQEQNRRVAEVLEIINLSGLENRYPRQLSGGQQQRVSLARALVLEPEVLLLDEPFSALDGCLRNQLEAQLLETLEKYHGCSLYITHNLEEAYRICTDLLLLEEGRIAAAGSKEELFERPPNTLAAKLTGCKNLSRARALGSGKVEALDWGCTLQVAQPLPAQLAHIGIREHHLSFASEKTLANTFPCRPAGIVESPHTVMLDLRLDGADHNPAHILQASLYKDVWETQREKPYPWLVRLDPTKLFLTEDN